MLPMHNILMQMYSTTIKPSVVFLPHIMTNVLVLDFIHSCSFINLTQKLHFYS